MKTSTADLCAAIKSGHRITFVYEDIKRLAEPYYIGQAADGGLMLGAWQNTGSGTGWRIFIIDKMTKIEVTDLLFDESRLQYSPYTEIFC